MHVRARWAGLAAALLLASQACWAQDADSMAARPLAPPTAFRPGRGALGAAAGGSQMVVDADYSKGAQPRLAFSGLFRYVITPRWRWQVSPFYSWAAYKTATVLPLRDPNFPADDTKDRLLTQVVGANAQLQFMLTSGPWRWHAGVGPAAYRVWIENRRKLLADPVTFERHSKIYPGAAAEIGSERFLKSLPNTSIEMAAGMHFVLSDDGKVYPSAFNSNLGMVELRLGANYYFDFGPRKPAVPALPGLNP